MAGMPACTAEMQSISPSQIAIQWPGFTSALVLKTRVLVPLGEKYFMGASLPGGRLKRMDRTPVGLRYGMLMNPRTVSLLGDTSGPSTAPSWNCLIMSRLSALSFIKKSKCSLPAGLRSCL